MRVMLDTNVLLSAFIFRSPTLERTIELASTGDNQLLLSTYVIDEAREVVARKWPDRAHALEDLLLHLSFETIVTPLTMDKERFKIRDPMDYPVLYSALIGAADLFITGDKDFDGIHVDGIEILTPSEYVNIFGNNI